MNEIVKRPDWYLIWAQKTHGVPKGWRWYLLSSDPNGVPDGYTKIVGCVPDGVYRSGPRKGRPNFSKPVEGTLKTLLAHHAAVKYVMDEWERETGLCRHCGNTGQRLLSVGALAGMKYTDCGRCHRKAVSYHEPPKTGLFRE